MGLWSFLITPAIMPKKKIQRDKNKQEIGKQ